MRLPKPANALTPYPRGWYLAAYSDELTHGAVKSLRLFGQNLAIFRDASGTARLVDAYCPHLGASLAHGGTVVGDCVRCPFHGWEFRADTGACTRTGNGDPPPARARLRTWPLAERHGMVLVWYHDAGETPSWEVGALPESDEPGWSAWSHHEWKLEARIQDISENDADISHSPVMHGFTDVLPEIAMDADGARCEWRLKAKFKLEAFGVPTPPKIGLLRKLAAPLPSDVNVVRWGLSLGWVRGNVSLPGGIPFRTQTMATTTPIDPEHVRLTLRHRVRRAPIAPMTSLVLNTYARLFNTTVEQDIVIWENKIYRMRPMPTKSDWAIMRFRKWARQFYSDSDFDAAMERESGPISSAVGGE